MPFVGKLERRAFARKIKFCFYRFRYGIVQDRTYIFVCIGQRYLFWRRFCSRHYYIVSSIPVHKVFCVSAIFPIRLCDTYHNKHANIHYYLILLKVFFFSFFLLCDIRRNNYICLNAHHICKSNLYLLFCRL